jgi:hypothetical protein
MLSPSQQYQKNIIQHQYHVIHFNCYLSCFFFYFISQIITVELNKGWNSRLGFSLQYDETSNHTLISAIYEDSVAAKDGRLQINDQLLMVRFQLFEFIYIATGSFELQLQFILNVQHQRSYKRNATIVKSTGLWKIPKMKKN